jgi:hypothetical protein
VSHFFWVVRSLFVVAPLLSVPAFAQGSLPDPLLTPGAINPAVTQDNIKQTICRPGWTKTIRPSSSYIVRIKRAGMLAYNYPLKRWSDYVEDHRIPLEVGGDPKDPLNLWPQLIYSPDGWDDRLKNDLEDTLHRQVCSGVISLADAQAAFRGNWHLAYWRDVKGVHVP